MQQRDKLENHDTKTILDKLVRIETVSGASTNEIIALIEQHCDSPSNVKIIVPGQT